MWYLLGCDRKWGTRVNSNLPRICPRCRCAYGCAGAVKQHEGKAASRSNERTASEKNTIQLLVSGRLRGSPEKRKSKARQAQQERDHTKDLRNAMTSYAAKFSYSGRPSTICCLIFVLKVSDCRKIRFCVVRNHLELDFKATQKVW